MVWHKGCWMTKRHHYSKMKINNSSVRSILRTTLDEWFIETNGVLFMLFWNTNNLLKNSFTRIYKYNAYLKIKKFKNVPCVYLKQVLYTLTNLTYFYHNHSFFFVFNLFSSKQAIHANAVNVKSGIDRLNATT